MTDPKNDPLPRERPIPIDPDALIWIAPLASIGVIGHVFGFGFWLWPIVGAISAAFLAFFRDPPRRGPETPGAIWSPADGRVTHIEPNGDAAAGPVPGVRVSIFLSVLDVHINRAPCAGRVRRIRYERGKFFDARHPDSATKNESNWIFLDTPHGPVTVRQIAGLIARRIVCRAREGDALRRGERIGLIRMGSRTDVILPDGAEIKVEVGDRVYGGRTAIAEFPSPPRTPDVAG